MTAPVILHAELDGAGESQGFHWSQQIGEPGEGEAKLKMALIGKLEHVRLDVGRNEVVIISEVGYKVLVHRAPQFMALESNGLRWW